MTALSVQQRYYATLRMGFVPTVEYGTRSGIKVHCRQGEWDSACGLHCAAMALTLLGRLNGVADLLRRKNGAGAALWRAGIESYFEGINGAALSALVSSVASGVLTKDFKESHGRLVRRSVNALERGQLVAMNWCSKGDRYDHWVLAVGLEGIQQGALFDESAVLCLDPSEPEPILSAYNGRLQLNTAQQNRSLKGFVPYVTSQGLSLMVTLKEIVTISDGSTTEV